MDEIVAFAARIAEAMPRPPPRQCKMCGGELYAGQCDCGDELDRVYTAMSRVVRETRASATLLECCRRYFGGDRGNRSVESLETALLEWMREREHR